MVKLIVLLIALCFLLLLGYTRDVGKEVSELKAMDRLHSKEIIALRGQIGVTDDKCDRIKAEVADLVKPFTRIIPVDGGFLGMREEKSP